MPNYRLYFVGGGGHFRAVRQLIADDDGAAIGDCSLQRGNGAMELWCGTRKAGEWAQLEPAMPEGAHDHDEIFDEPSKVNAQDGIVSVDGPDGVEILLTPDAAIETSDRLLEGAAKARGQQFYERNKP